MSEPEIADLIHMLSVRGVLPQPQYTDKPARRNANKAGGGRNQRKTMRGTGVSAEADVVASEAKGLNELESEEEKMYQGSEVRKIEEENGLMDPMCSEDEDAIFRKIYGWDSD